mmetsp:Transcript_12661/g.27323  ORF Transcript_12661/g.27323 Transcript_12661/m.27323 type:complete len:224 (-) Transcript_12661:62-733(-)
MARMAASSPSWAIRPTASSPPTFRSVSSVSGKAAIEHSNRASGDREIAERSELWSTDSSNVVSSDIWVKNRFSTVLDRIFPMAVAIILASSAVISGSPSRLLLLKMAPKLSKHVRERLSSFSSMTFSSDPPCIAADSAAMALFLTPKRSTAAERAPALARLPRVRAKVCLACPSISKRCAEASLPPVTRSNRATSEDFSARSSSPSTSVGSGSKAFSYRSNAA